MPLSMDTHNWRVSLAQLSRYTHYKANVLHKYIEPAVSVHPVQLIKKHVSVCVVSQMPDEFIRSSFS